MVAVNRYADFAGKPLQDELEGCCCWSNDVAVNERLLWMVSLSEIKAVCRATWKSAAA